MGSKGTEAEADQQVTGAHGVTSVADLLELLRSRGLLERTHTIQVGDVRVEMAINPRELHGSEDTSKADAPKSFDELLRRQLGLPREEKPQ